MKLTQIGQVIATREIKIHGSAEPGYVVKIGLPMQFTDSPDFYCPIQISGGPTETNLQYSVGIDSVQALQLALKQVGGILFRLNQELEGKLRWDGDERGDLGFPLPI